MSLFFHHFHRSLISMGIGAWWCFATPLLAADAAPVHVAITKITAHPSLDLIEKGILDVVKEAFPKGKITLKNAQGNITVAAQIAQQFASLNPTVVVPITTPSAQTITKAFRGKDTPIIFSAVTDPIGAHLLPSLDRETTTLTGVVDQPPVDKIVEMMKLVNENLKVIGVLYNASEANSEFQIAALRTAAEKLGIALREVPVTKASDVQLATTALVSDVQAIFLPNDNLVISAIEGILKGAHSKKIPVYVSDPESVTRGAFATLAIDQYDIGRETGKLVVAVIKSQGVTDHPPVVMQTPRLYVNERVAKDLSISAKTLAGIQQRFGHATSQGSIQALK